MANFSDSSTRDVSTTATWVSTDNTIATVSSSGMVTAKVAGSTTIRATFSGVAGSIPFTVLNPSSIAITTSSPSSPLGLTQQLTATASFSDGTERDVTSVATWTSMEPSIATVSAAGMVTTKSVGSTSIKADYSGASGSTAFTVAPPAVTAISLSVDITPLLIGSAHQLAVTGRYTDGVTRDATASSSFQMTNPYVMGIDSQQRLTAVGEGITSITATNHGATSSSVEVRSYSKPRFAYAPDSTRVSAYVVDENSGLLRPTTYSTLSYPTVDEICITSIDRTFVVVSHSRSHIQETTVSGFLSIFQVDLATGELTFVANAYPNLTSPDGPGCAVVHPSGRFFYAATESGFVSAFRFDRVNSQAPEVNDIWTGASPRSITMDPLGRFLYVGNGGSTDISAFSIDPATGALKSIPGAPIQGFAGANIVSIDPRGRFAVVSGNGTDQMAVYTIGSSGLFTLVPGSQRTVPPGPSRVVFDPTGSYVYFTGFVLDNNLNSHTVLEVDSFNPATGALSKVATVNLPDGAGGTPVIDPEGKRLYIGGFYVYPIQGDGTLAAPSSFRAGLSISSSSPLSFVGSTVPAVMSTPYVYAATPANNSIVQFAFQPGGQLSNTVSTVASGNVVSLSSDFFGRYVFSAVAQSAVPNMFEFTADSSTGLLSAVASPFSLVLQVPELVQTDRIGGFLYVTDSFAPEKVRAFERLPNGTLGAFYPGRLTIGHTSSLALDPFTRFLLVANRDDNSISGYDVWSTSGDFSSNAFVSGSYATGTTPVAVYIEPLGRFVYTANHNSSDVSAFQVANFAGSDTLNSVGTFPVAPSPAVLVADPFGKLLFVGSSNGSIAAYSIDPATGALTAAAAGITASGAVQALGIDASGAYLIAGTSSGLFVYSFQDTGGLTPVNQTAPAPAGSFTSITMPTAIN